MEDEQGSPTAKSEGLHDLSTASPHTTVGDGGPFPRAGSGAADRGEGEGTADGGAPKAKRRRVAVACKSCRYRKSRVR